MWDPTRATNPESAMTLCYEQNVATAFYSRRLIASISMTAFSPMWQRRQLPVRDYGEQL